MKLFSKPSVAAYIFGGLLLASLELRAQDYPSAEKSGESPCSWMKQEKPYALADGKVPDLLKKLDRSLDFLAALKLRRNGEGLSNPEIECNAQMQAKLDQAIDSLKVALVKSADYWVWLGRYQSFKEDIPGGIKSFNKAIELEGLHVRANFALGKIQLERGQRDAALKNFRRVALVEKPTAADKAIVVFALRTLVAGLESLPDRVLDFAATLSRLDRLDSGELRRLARLAMGQKLYGKAEAFAAQLPTEERPLIEVELARARGEMSTERIEKIKRVLRSQRLLEELRKEGIRALIDEWITVARGLKNWSELRAAAKRGLKNSPANAAFLHDFEEGVREGRVAGYKELREAAKVHPTSSYIQQKLVEECLLPSLRKGVGAKVPTQLLEQGELHLARLEAVSPDLLDVKAWRAYVLSKKKSFRTADLIFTTAAEKLRAKEQFTGALREVDFWREAARVKEARGYTSEAVALLKEGLSRTDRENEKIYLKRAIEEIQRADARAGT